MVPRAIIFASILSCGALVARADLQFSPQRSAYQLDGIKFEQLAFTDGARQVTYAPPSHWSYTGSGDQLTLHPPNKSQAEATILRRLLPEPAVFDEAGLKKLTDEALAALPAGNTDPVIISAGKNPLMINGRETFLIKLAFTFYGEKFSRSVLFLNRGKEQLRFQLTCRAADFEQLHKAFFDSHFSWQNL